MNGDPREVVLDPDNADDIEPVQTSHDNQADRPAYNRKKS